MSPSKDTPTDDPFAGLTWDDLEAWAGSRVVGRGRGYHRQGRVIAIARPEPDTLVGHVMGGRLYSTQVTWGEDDAEEEPSSRCSCPYGIDCKHGVAIVLEYLDRLKAGSDVPDHLPDADADDPAAELDEWEDDDWDGFDDGEGVPADDGDPIVDTPAPTTRDYLEGLSKAELIDLVMALTATGQPAGDLLKARVAIGQGKAGAVARAARAELRRVASEPGWQDHWGGGGSTPDYSRVSAYLESLTEAGAADLVLDLGQEILELGTQQVEQSHDEGETAEEISGCLTRVWDALERSSLGRPGRILWFVDRVLQDEYDLCHLSDDSPVLDADAAEWSEVADALLARLEPREPAAEGDEEDWGARYERNRVADWALRALDHAGRTEDALTLCIAEAPVTQSYERAVKRLIGAGRVDEAHGLAVDGMSRTQARWPGIAAALRDQLRQIAEERGEPDVAAALAGRAFFENPSLSGYRDLREAVEPLDVWPDVRRLVLDALATGPIPGPAQGWPLPEIELPLSEESTAFDAPYHQLLTEIALDEDDPDQAVKWFRELEETGRAWGWWDLPERVARAVASTHPDESVTIWQKLAAGEIARGNRRAYEASLRYLRPMRDLLTKLDRRDEWQAYIGDLREENSRRWALIETLDRLDGGRIIDE